MAQTARPTRAGGRPRSPEADTAILVATRELLSEVGYDRLTIEAVALRAGVSKATIYRRYSGKRPLVSAALDELRREVEFPDTGSLRGDLELLLSMVDPALRQPGASQLTATVFSAVGREDGLFEELWEAVIVPRRQTFGSLFARARDRGELREEVDLEQVLDLFGAVLLYQSFRPSARPASVRMRESLEHLWPSITADGRSPFASDPGHGRTPG
jgi:AcrR family transcriptional regulator